MLAKLDSKLSLREHYSDRRRDMLSHVCGDKDLVKSGFIGITYYGPRWNSMSMPECWLFAPKHLHRRKRMPLRACWLKKGSDT